MRALIINPKNHNFHFPIKKPDLNKQWIRFANRINWVLTHSVLCELHFKEHFINCTQRCNLKRRLNPVPSIYSIELLKSPSSMPTPVTKRRPLTHRIYQEDEMQHFNGPDITSTFDDLNKNQAPPEIIIQILLITLTYVLVRTPRSLKL